MSRLLTVFVAFATAPLIFWGALFLAAVWTVVFLARAVNRWADRRVARAFREAGVHYGPRDTTTYLFPADEFRETA